MASEEINNSTKTNQPRNEITQVHFHISFLARVRAILSYVWTGMTDWFRKGIDPNQGLVFVIRQPTTSIQQPLYILAQTNEWINSQDMQPSTCTEMRRVQSTITVLNSPPNRPVLPSSTHQTRSTPEQQQQRTPGQFMTDKIQDGTRPLFYISVSTTYGKEQHAVGLLINPRDHEIFYLDSKGCNPDELPMREQDRTTQGQDNTTPKPCTPMDLIRKIIDLYPATDAAKWTVISGPNWQQPLDCVLCTAVLAKVAAETPIITNIRDHLQTKIEEYARNYQPITTLRRDFLKHPRT